MGYTNYKLNETAENNMKILIACEAFGRVRDAFLEKGHDVISCDILPTDSPGPHYQGDVLDIINDGFDMMIAFPPCTYLTCSGEWAYKDIQTKNIKPGTLIGAERRQARFEAADFFMQLANAGIEKKVIENPVGVMSRIFRKPDQYIQPYRFGDDASKKTCLWLHNVPSLEQTSYILPRYVNGLPRWANQTDSGQNREPPSAERGRIRGKMWQGIADAMAEQWG